MWDGFDKRKFPRLNLHCEITIRATQDEQPIKAMTENVGLGGICVILNQVLPRFTQCRIWLGLNEKGNSIEGAGRVVWNVPTSDSAKGKKCYDTGIEFTQLAVEDQDVLKKFLQAYLGKEGLKISL